MKDNIKIIEESAKELLSLMGTSTALSVSFDKENEAYLVDIEGGEETGLLIGRKGDTLHSLQSILSAIMKTKTGEWVRVVVNVGDYNEKEEEYLKGLAQSAAEKAKDSGEPQFLYNLKPAQRRIVHMELSSNSEVTTESQGEGRDRYLVVKVK